MFKEQGDAADMIGVMMCEDDGFACGAKFNQAIDQREERREALEVICARVEDHEAFHVTNDVGVGMSGREERGAFERDHPCVCGVCVLVDGVRAVAFIVIDGIL